MIASMSREARRKQGNDDLHCPFQKMTLNSLGDEDILRLAYMYRRMHCCTVSMAVQKLTRAFCIAFQFASSELPVLWVTSCPEKLASAKCADRRAHV